MGRSRAGLRFKDRLVNNIILLCALKPFPANLSLSLSKKVSKLFTG